MGKRSFGLFSLMVVALFAFAACGEAEKPTATAVTFNPTPGGAPAPTAPPSNETAVPQPTSAPFVPDAAAGQVTFQTNCTTCHNTSADTLVGPGLAGLADRAGATVGGLSADEYIRASIVDPGSFVVDGFPPIMPQFTQLDAEDIENLLTYLKTLQ